MIAFGLFLNALMASGIITATPIYPVLKGMLVSALATLGWCLVFNVPRQNLWQCIVITGLGYGLRNTLLNLNMSLVSATFFASMVSSGLGIYCDAIHFRRIFANNIYFHPNISNRFINIYSKCFRAWARFTFILTVKPVS